MDRNAKKIETKKMTRSDEQSAAAAYASDVYAVYLSTPHTSGVRKIARDMFISTEHIRTGVTQHERSMREGWGQEIVTFTKLRNGCWGLRGKGMRPGDVVHVTKKSGLEELAEVDRILWTGPDGIQIAIMGLNGEMLGYAALHVRQFEMEDRRLSALLPGRD